MRYTLSDFRVGPEFTPPTIKKLILYTCLISIFATIGTTLSFQLFSSLGPEYWLSLSWQGVTNYYLWQPITYLFVQYTATFGFSIGYFITLLLQMFILWTLGSQVLERVGRAPFLRLYFTSGILAGILTLLLMRISGYYDIFAGPTPSLLAILVVWTLMYPETELLLFFLIPVKAKWLTSGLITVFLLLSIPGDFIRFILYFFACVIGYLYGLIAWGLRSPFPIFVPLESFILKCTQKVKKIKPPSSTQSPHKVFDIFTGEPKLDDDRFVDAMLEKISKKGEKSLSWKERERMNAISERKRHEKNQR